MSFVFFSYTVDDFSKEGIYNRKRICSAQECLEMLFNRVAITFEQCGE